MRSLNMVADAVIFHWDTVLAGKAAGDRPVGLW